MITVDRLDPPDWSDRPTSALDRRRSVVIGMGLSIAAMAAAALGFCPSSPGDPPEAIDIAVILNALRDCAADGGSGRGPGWTETSAIAAAHVELDRRSPGSAPRPMSSTACRRRGLGRPREIRRFVSDDLLPQRARGPDHLPDARQRDGFRRCDRVDVSDAPRDLPTRASARSPGPDLPSDSPSGDDRTDLQRLLYGLEASPLPQAREEGQYGSIADSTPLSERPTLAGAPVRP